MPKLDQEKYLKLSTDIKRDGSVWESFQRMPKLDQEEYLKSSTDIERDTGLSPLDLQIAVSVKQMYGNESLPTIGN